MCQQAFEETLLAYIEKNQLLSRGDRVLIAVSGGADSMALLCFLCRAREKLGIELGAAHLHHDMRGTVADEDAAFVKGFCDSHVVPFHFEKQDVIAWSEAEHLGVEVMGRMLRYDFFQRIMTEYEYNLLATAHHRDDQAETLLMRLIRGTGMAGAAGIAPRKGNRIRPLLCVGRRDIEGYCRACGISWRHDSTNDDPTPTRNRLRHLVLPLFREINPQANAHLADFCRRAGAYEALLESVVADIAPKVLTALPDGSVELNGRILERQCELVKEALVRKAFFEVAGTLVDVEQRHIVLLLAGMAEKDGSDRWDLPHGVEAIRSYDRLIFRKKRRDRKCPSDPVFLPQSLPGTVTFGENRFFVEISLNLDLNYLKNNKKKDEIILDCDRINECICFRTREPGDYVMLKHGQGHKKLKKLMIDQKISREIRDTLPLLTRGREILWIPGYWVSPSCLSSAGSGEQCIKISIWRAG